MLSNATLKKKYGITQEQWQEAFVRQGGVCAICKQHQRYQSLATDHDHKTGKFRGLLCVQCNRGLGRFFDSPIRLRNAAEYILKSRQTVGSGTQTPSTVETATPSQPLPPSPQGATCVPQAHN